MAAGVPRVFNSCVALVGQKSRDVGRRNYYHIDDLKTRDDGDVEKNYENKTGGTFDECSCTGQGETRDECNYFKKK